MIRAGVIGSPAKHSLSPLIHNAWLKAAGIEGHYGLYDIAAEDFEAVVSRLRGEGLAGLNVTVPFKERAAVLADRPTERVHAAGAANVLVFRDARVEADNTDGIGLLEAFIIRGFPLIWHSAPIVVLGAGGAARGAISALAFNGARVRIVNRTRARAEALARSVGGDITVHDWSDLPRALDGAGALVNGTSLGLEGGPPLEVDTAGLTAGAPVMDMVYKPLQTAFLKAAGAVGHPTIDGLDMLIGQARPSFEAFFGVRPPEDIDVRALCLAELARRG